MNSNLKVLIIALFVISILCCGGTLFFGQRLYSGAKVSHEQAATYASAKTAEFGKEWDSELLWNAFTPEVQRQTGRDKVDKICAWFKKGVGPLKDAGKFDVIGTYWVNGQTQVAMRSKATFERGEGTITFVAVTHEGGWALHNFRINSDALLDIPEITGEQKKK
jgi:hypothetical protein